VIHTNAKADSVDLAFNADSPSQLWVVSYKDNHVHVGNDVVPGPGTWRDLKDPAAVHFMHKPPAIAWGSGGFWATCGDNDNAQNDPRGAGEANFFMGPALFTSDLSIFTKQNLATSLGSHYDMLHNTSFCRGIAHVETNWYWVFNGELGSLDKYNFAQDHGPGNDDHSDGEIYRYAQGQVQGVTGLSSYPTAAVWRGRRLERRRSRQRARAAGDSRSREYRDRARKCTRVSRRNSDFSESAFGACRDDREGQRPGGSNFLRESR
jgi:hypothetical protein